MTTTAHDAAAPVEPSAAGREERFTAAVRRLRTTLTGAQVRRWFRLAGPVLMPLGALMIVLAWWGASNTTRVFLQIPYLISGAVLGLGFMVVGGFVYFARWLTDVLDALRAESHRAEQAELRTVEALERIEALLRTSLDAPGHAAARAGGASAAGTVDVPTAGELVTTEHGRMVHRATCRLVAGRSTRAVARREADEVDPCRICLPAGPDR